MTPGGFVVPPAKAEEIYHPETCGAPERIESSSSKRERIDEAFLLSVLGGLATLGIGQACKQTNVFKAGRRARLFLR